LGMPDLCWQRHWIMVQRSKGRFLNTLIRNLQCPIKASSYA
jgi:hypothetical protein